MSKGSERRPKYISDDEFADNWTRIFRQRGRGNPAQVRAIESEYRQVVQESRGYSGEKQAKGG